MVPDSLIPSHGSPGFAWAIALGLGLAQADTYCAGLRIISFADPSARDRLALNST